MATSYQKNEERPRQHEPIPDCEERDNATQVTINTFKSIYCDNLNTARHNVKKLEIVYSGKEKVYKKKERKFLKTQDNYQRYVNTEISIGSQLMEANKRVTANVVNYKTWDDNLAKALRDLFTTIKDVKSKPNDLRDAAVKIDNSQFDSCSTAQWSLLTGKNPDNCKEDTKPHPPHTEHCKDIEDVIELLICMPKALAFDIDSIFKSSSDIIGIQKFCNVISLVSMQADLSAKTKDFDDLMLNTIKARKTDLEASQKDLVQALQDRTDAVIDVYNQRCDYDAVYRTVDEICCPKCRCVDVDEGGVVVRVEVG